jgi:hypothetical protein
MEEVVGEYEKEELGSAHSFLSLPGDGGRWNLTIHFRGAVNHNG